MTMSDIVYNSLILKSTMTRDLFAIAGILVRLYLCVFACALATVKSSRIKLDMLGYNVPRSNTGHFVL